ncbi:MAG: methyltransferase [Jatrophihabitans sp.]|uniref:methyltransferase n=1 Tax=Jatrophihabitans sp. TaxID=1932789 RepID=UPI00390EF1CA
MNQVTEPPFPSAPAASPQTAAQPAPLELLAGAPPAVNRMYGVVLGFWSSQIAGTLARLEIPDQVADGPRSGDELATATGCLPAALLRLLRAATTVGILTEQPGRRFALTEMGAALRTDVPGSLAGLARAITASAHWLPWGRLDDAIRTGRSTAQEALAAPFFDYLAGRPRECADFAAAMEDLSTMIAAAVVDRLDLTGARDIVDVGGGTGTLLTALLARHPELQGAVLERPEVVDRARAHIHERGLDERCAVAAGDFFTAVPEADVLVLKLILHDWDDEHATAILRACAAGLRPDGRLILIEAVVPDDPSAVPLLPLLDVNMLVVLGGHERTAAEFTALLAGAGLRLDRITETGSHGQIIEARHA